MQVVKRDGTCEPVQFDKITDRLRKLCDLKPPIPAVDIARVAKHACAACHDKIQTETLDHIAADASVALATEHLDYSALAARILISNLQKNTHSNVLEVYAPLQHVISEHTWKVIQAHHEQLDAMVDFTQDYRFDFFGFKTLQKAYLLEGERPQHLYIRVAIGIWGHNMERVEETYQAMSAHLFTHASPTLFNAGCKSPQLASCFLMGIHEDSLDNIMETLHKSASISKFGGGIGLHVHAVRSKGSIIRSTNGKSDGLVPLLKVCNELFRYVNQCFTPYTLIYTTRGVQEIQHITEGAKVQGKDGAYHKVTQVMTREVEKEDMVRIHALGSMVTCTPRHDVYCLRGGESTLIPAGELEPTDMMRFPVATEFNNPPGYNEAFCKFYGMVLFHGTINANMWRIQLGNDSMWPWLMEYFVANKILYTCRDTYVEFHVRHMPPDLVYEPHYGEIHMHHTFMYVSPNNTYALLDGMCGYTGEEKYVYIESMQRFLIPGLQHTCFRLGIIPEMLENGVIKIGGTSVIQDNTIYVPIKQLERVQYTGLVYDLNVEDANSYTTVAGVVHNSGKRKGSCAIYIEPHHADIMAVLELKRNQGDEHLRARDLFYGLWLSDLFMERVEAGEQWSLFDPNTATGLEDVYGQEYRDLYTAYEEQGLAVKTLPAQDVWFAILRSQIETGVPYMLYKDACNTKSNQKNLGTIKNSNLCTEIIEYTAKDEIAVCNLGSLSLPAFVSDGCYNYDALHAATKVLTRNLNQIIDVTYYPVTEAEHSNVRHRPIGIGVQGLADVFFRLHVPFESETAQEINTKIFATIYHAAVESSCDLVDERKSAILMGLLGPEETPWYSSFPGSPISEGLLQPDLWNVAPHPMYDWDALRRRAMEGVRNSLLVAPMPTASTGQLLGNTEAFEPITSNLYSRTTLAGTFTVVNKHLLKDLIDANLWSKELKNQIVAAEGSVQHLDLPQKLKDVYKTAYEISMKSVLNLAAERAPYVDQSMSLNMFMAEPTIRKLTSMHFYAWKRGLKTGMYYLRSKAASTATKITVEHLAGNAEHVDDSDVCISCSG